MKSWLRVFAGIALAAIFISSAIYLRRPPNPIFEGRHASAWADDLLSPDYSVRGEAQTALQIMGPAAVPQLVAILEERDAPWEKHLVRLNSMITFLDYRPRNATLCQVRAAEMLGLLGTKAAPAIPHLIEVLAMAPSSIEAERALLRIGAASTEHLQRALASKNPRVREHSARLLREFAPLDVAAIAPLVAASRDEIPAVRREAALSLGTFRGAPDRVVAALFQRTSDKDEAVRAAAFESLGKASGPSQKVFAALLNGLNDGSPAVELEAAKALWKLQPDGGAIVPVLTRILSTGERWRAAYALGEIGPAAAAAVPALVKALEAEEVPRPFRTPPSAAFALGKIGQPAIEDLAGLLAHKQARVRVSALLAFGFMGENGHDAVPRVMKLLDDKEAEVRHIAALTLASIGAEKKLIIAGLADCLGDEDIYVRSAAAAALRDLAPEGDWIVQPE